MKRYKGYLIDLDGTMYRGTEPIDEAPLFIKRLMEKNLPYLFVTNNSTSRPEEVAERLREGHNIPAESGHVYTSAMATAEYVRQLNGSRVYVIGEHGLVSALEEAGCKLVDTDIDHVVVGLDRDLTYEKCETASLAIQNGASFIATNEDTNVPSEKGLIPGAGAIISLIEKATHVKPTFVGKPEEIMMKSALEKIKLPKEDVVMVGDNYQTDILAAINSGIDSILVLTGYTTIGHLESVMIQPTSVIHTLNDWSV